MRSMLILLTAAALAAAPTAKAGGWLYESTVTIAPGQTNAVGELTLKANTMAESAVAELDFVTIRNESGFGTGTVAWVSSVLGAETEVDTVSGIAPGVRSTRWPRRTYTLNAPTNDAAVAETYLTRSLIVRVRQSSTNATPTVYSIGAGTR